MRILKFFGVIAAAIVVLSALLLGAAVVINWRDAAPSAAYLHLERLIANRPPLGDAENGYVYLLGMRAAPDVDPRYLGVRRLTWLDGLDHDMSRLNQDPAAGGIDYTQLRSPSLGTLGVDCDTADWRKCQATFEALPEPGRWTVVDRLQADRYRELIRYAAWREHVATDIRQPFAGFGDAIWGQRLYLLALRGGDARTLHEALARDHAFWRMALASSDTLITKLIAVSALRQHFRFGNLLLRRLPPEEAAHAIPDGWREPLTHEELSVESILAGELAQMDKLWRNPAAVGTDTSGRVPFYQPQDVRNEIAADYRAIASAFDVPLPEYARVEEEWRTRPPNHPFMSRVYDLGGDYLRQMARARYEKYPPRIAAVEAWRRAALAVAELRARGVPSDRVPAELEASALKNPFDGRPFSWSSAEKAVIYEGTEDQSLARRRQVYVY